MIIKKYAESEQLKAMKLLLHRLPTKHSLYPKLYTEIQTTIAGDYGEEVVYRELEKIQLPYKYYLFHKVMLRTEKMFEMDFLLLTPFGAVILEIKNIVGELEFKINPSQLVQSKGNGEINRYPCPANQLNEYIYLLSSFFASHNHSIPVHGAIIFASKNSYVKTSTNETTILYKNEIYSFLRNLQNQTSLISDTKLSNIKDLIRKQKSTFNYFPLTKFYFIEQKDLIKGVACERCGQVGMMKVKNLWHCTSCQYSDKDASSKTIEHYFLLCEDYITNKACRQFLLLENRFQVNRLFKRSGLKKIGNNKSTKYIRKV